jgi:hypothetical protein
VAAVQHGRATPTCVSFALSRLDYSVTNTRLSIRVNSYVSIFTLVISRRRRCSVAFAVAAGVRDRDGVVVPAVAGGMRGRSAAGFFLTAFASCERERTDAWQHGLRRRGLDASLFRTSTRKSNIFDCNWTVRSPALAAPSALIAASLSATGSVSVRMSHLD